MSSLRHDIIGGNIIFGGPYSQCWTFKSPQILENVWSLFGSDQSNGISERSPFARKDSSPNLHWIYIYDDMRHRDLAP